MSLLTPLAIRPASRRTVCSSPLLFLGAFFLWILLAPSAIAQSDGKIRGIISSNSDGSPLPNANVILATGVDSSFRAATTNVDGYYEIEGIPAGRYYLRVSYVGFNTYRDTIELGTERMQKNIQLLPRSEELSELTVEADEVASERQAGLRTVDPASVGRVPTPGPSGDLAAYLSTLPSVTSVGDRGGQLYVRGGTPSQNLIRVDGLSIINPFHISSLYSAFPEELLKSADVYAGGFGAEYAGALSSVIDVTLRNGNMKDHEGTASVSPFIASALVEGPIYRGTTSFLGSVRYSLIEQTASSLTGQSAPLQFYDLTGRYSLQRETAQCSFTGMHTFDQGRINPDRETVLRWRNTTVGGRCLLFGEGLGRAIDVSAGYTGFNNSAGSSDNPERFSSIQKGYFSVSRDQDAFGGTLSLGGRWDITNYSYELGERFTAFETNNFFLTRLHGYAAMVWEIGTRITVSPSIATQYHTEADVPTYEPRLRIFWKLGGSDRRKLSVAVGKYKQIIEGITDTRDAGTVFTIWTPASQTAKAPGALHGILGYQEQITSSLKLSVEGYGKKMDNIPVPRWSPVASFNTRTTPADGIAYGADVQATVNTSSFYLSLKYGWSNVTYEADTGNLGAWVGGDIFEYSPAHDRRHQLSFVASYELFGVTADVSWEFGSGRPYTKLYGFDLALRSEPPGRGENPIETSGRPLAIYDRPYGGRLPHYHRLDVSLNRSFEISPGLSAEAAIGTVNTYNRKNISYLDVNTLDRVNQTPLLPYLSLQASIN